MSNAGKFEIGDRVVVREGANYVITVPGSRGTVLPPHSITRSADTFVDFDGKGTFNVCTEDLELISPEKKGQWASSRQRVHHDESRKQAALKVWRENQQFDIAKSDVARLFGIKQSTFNMWTLELQVEQTSGNTVKVRGGFPVGSTVEDLLAAMLDELHEIKENTKRRTN